MNARTWICLVLLGLGTCWFADAAAACDRPFYADYALTSWLWPSGSLYVRDATPPYFALFPPVYYSYSVPRTYGFSPYAYPPGTITPPTRQLAPLMVHNAYLDGQRTSTEAGAQKRPPLRIANPFVSQSAEPVAPSQP